MTEQLLPPPEDADIETQDDGTEVPEEPNDDFVFDYLAAEAEDALAETEGI